MNKEINEFNAEESIEIGKRMCDKLGGSVKFREKRREKNKKRRENRESA